MLDSATSFYAQIKSLSSGEAKVLRNLTKQKDIIVQKADKGNPVVILDKESYIEKMKELSSDASKFERLEIPPGKHLDFVINSQDKMKNIKRLLLICYMRKFGLFDAALGFYMANLRYANLSLTIVHLLHQYLTLLIHHRISKLNFL